jgi:hypothetical protein
MFRQHSNNLIIRNFNFCKNAHHIQLFYITVCVYICAHNKTIYSAYVYKYGYIVDIREKNYILYFNVLIEELKLNKNIYFMKSELC